MSLGFKPLVGSVAITPVSELGFCTEDFVSPIWSVIAEDIICLSSSYCFI